MIVKFFIFIFLLVFNNTYANNQLTFQKEQDVILNSKFIQTDGRKSKFGFNLNKDFKHYVDYTIRLIKNYRLDLDKYAIFTIRSNAPFIFNPLIGCPGGNDKRFANGVILIHDLGASPYQMQHLAHIFNSKCMMVYSLLLVGHGTRPSDLIGISYMEWMKQLSYAVNELSKHVDNVYLSGIGMGATLAMNYTLDEHSFIKGLFLFSPLIYFTNANNMFISKVSLYFNVWNKLNKNINRVAYDNIPYQAYYELSRLAYLVQKKIKQIKLNIPFFAVFSKDDNLTDFTYSFNALKNSSSNDDLTKFIIYYGINHQVNYNQKDLVNIYDSEIPIYDISGSSIVIPDYDWWYGKYSVYKSCNHYFNENSIDLYEKCMSNDNFYSGIPSKSNLKRGIIRNNTYNPMFNHMKDALNKFINIHVLKQDPIEED